MIELCYFSLDQWEIKILPESDFDALHAYLKNFFFNIKHISRESPCSLIYFTTKRQVTTDSLKTFLPDCFDCTLLEFKCQQTVFAEQSFKQLDQCWSHYHFTRVRPSIKAGLVGPQFFVLNVTNCIWSTRTHLLRAMKCTGHLPWQYSRLLCVWQERQGTVQKLMSTTRRYIAQAGTTSR